jgi:hypothetical protein
MKDQVKMVCKNCKWFKSEQAELAYQKTKGFCISPKLEYNTTDGCSITLLDRNNLHPTTQCTTHRLENIRSFEGAKQRSNRYVLVVNDEFGCINFTEK